MRTLIAVTVPIACALVLGCSRGSTPAPSETLAPSEGRVAAPSTAPPAPGEVRWFGALRAIMHEGRTESSVRLVDVVPGPRAWGVGALEDLRGEVTILDDIVWLARPKPDGTTDVTHGPISDVDSTEGAALLVVANVAAWDELAITATVAWSALDAFLESQLLARGEALDVPVPLRIDGPVTALHWHVVDGSKVQPGAGHALAAVSGVIEHVDAELVGFFSRAHQGVFTHAGSHSHFHVVTRDGAVSGHVDGVDLASGAHLLVPRR